MSFFTLNIILQQSHFMGNTHYLFCPTRVGSLMQSRFWGSLQSMGTEKISIKIIFHRLELRSVYKDVKFSHTGLIENSLFSNVCDAFRTERGRWKIKEVGGMTVKRQARLLTREKSRLPGEICRSMSRLAPRMF